MNESDSKGYTIKVSMLISILLSFTVGVIMTLVLLKVTGGKAETLSTIGLVSFVFGIAVSGASIVLAIAAISLGKSSERIMIERSDESIRLQNEVFLKTTDALQRIESSTGVTEKRIEDIISGRAGAISREIAQLAHTGSTFKDRGEFERQIKESILREVAPKRSVNEAEEEQKALQERMEQHKRYKLFNGKVMLAFANRADTTSEKIGDGRFDGSGDELFDGIYVANGRRLAVSSLGAHSLRTVAEGDYLTRISKAIAEGRIEKAYLVVDAEEETVKQFRNKCKETLDALKFGDNIQIVGIPLEAADKAATMLINGSA